MSPGIQMGVKAHEHLKWAQWRIPHQPEFFDHHIDLYYQWLKKRDPFGQKEAFLAV